jgi:phage protein D
MNTPRFVPEFRLEIDGADISAAMRASVMSVVMHTGLEGADRVEVRLVNDGLRWQDDPQLRLDHDVVLHLGYADEGLEQVFVGEIVGTAASFPQNGPATVTFVAQDARQRLQRGTKVRWFAIPIPTVGNIPIPDLITAPLVSLENQLIPILDPVGAAISVLLAGVEAVAAISEPGGMQKMIRKQSAESDYAFLKRIAKENGWEMYVEHAGAIGGHALRFESPMGHLDPDVFLQWGQTLVDFHPKISTVGQVFAITGYVWVPAIKMVFVVTIGWDWDRMALTLSVYPSVVPIGQAPAEHLVQEPLSPASAPRKLVSEILPRLNKRITATGSTLGEPRLRAASVLRIDGVGEQFGGLWRATEVTHTFDSSGFRTQFELRKEVWFGSIPAPDQGAIPVRVRAPFVG